MVYDLLNDIKSYLEQISSDDDTAKGLVDRLGKVMMSVYNPADTDMLQKDEIVVRICPATQRPVLAVHSTDGYAVCLHNDSVEQDMADVKQWLESSDANSNYSPCPSTTGYFPITSVHRDDLEAKGFDGSRITDEQMEELAKRMANDYCEQLFWISMPIIAECMGLPKKRSIPDEDIYVLVEFPEDASAFEEANIGFPSWSSEDNGARYVPMKDYVRVFNKEPDEEYCFCAVCWPDSQEYMELADDSDSRIELIQDEVALEEFGSSAYWVPIEIMEKENN